MNCNLTESSSQSSTLHELKAGIKNQNEKIWKHFIVFRIDNIGNSVTELFDLYALYKAVYI